MPPFAQPLCAVASPKRQQARLHRRDFPKCSEQCRACRGDPGIGAATIDGLLIERFPSYLSTAAGRWRTPPHAA